MSYIIDSISETNIFLIFAVILIVGLAKVKVFENKVKFHFSYSHFIIQTHTDLAHKLSL